jgi:hypothetical protein
MMVVYGWQYRDLHLSDGLEISWLLRWRRFVNGGG